MSVASFRWKYGVTLVGGGEILPGDLDLALGHAPGLVAADGGAQTALTAGFQPEKVIGDMDSINVATRDAFSPEDVVLVEEQDSTDFQKCLSRIAAPLILGLGFLGGRVDHELAALSALAQHPHDCILLGKEDIVFCAGSALNLELPRSMRFSLFPMGPVTGGSEGLKWPIDGLDMRPNGTVGTSNMVVGPVRLRVDQPGLLVILPRAALEVVLAALESRQAASRAE